jgi:hypothetical protein
MPLIATPAATLQAGHVLHRDQLFENGHKAQLAGCELQLQATALGKQPLTSRPQKQTLQLLSAGARGPQQV